MCSIFGSFDKQTLIELAKLNGDRGSFSHSISFHRPDRIIQIIERDFGPIDQSLENLNIPPETYVICHQQAPTGDKPTKETIHPAEKDGFPPLKNYLWHNGILKPETIAMLKPLYPDTTEWDTALLLAHILSAPSASETLSMIDGSFACVAAIVYAEITGPQHMLYLFRNEIAPLFIDDKYNISSVQFPNSESITPGTIYAFEPGFHFGSSGAKFDTNNNPFYFGV